MSSEKKKEALVCRCEEITEEEILQAIADGCTTVDALYPSGEGAGYAGGIMSAALDGLKTAEKIIARFAPPDKR